MKWQTRSLIFGVLDSRTDRLHCPGAITKRHTPQNDCAQGSDSQSASPSLCLALLALFVTARKDHRQERTAVMTIIQYSEEMDCKQQASAAPRAGFCRNCDFS